MRHWHESERMLAKSFDEAFADDDAPLIQQALRTGACFRSKTVMGRPRFDVAEFDATMRRVGGRPFYATDTWRGFSFPCARVTRSTNNGVVTVNLDAASEGALSALVPFVTEWLEPIPAVVPPPMVHSFGKSGSDFVVRELGTVTGDLRRANYGATIMAQFDRVVSELRKRDPVGRLVLMEGEPGTGKTHLIRAMIVALSAACRCILIPPNCMADLAGPSFLQALLNQRQPGRPLVLILEDADDCLIARDENHAAKASLSSLLNLSDGIVGAALDLRVIATTNQTLEAIDKAVLRPGRLLQRMSVGALAPAEADACFRSLTGRSRSYDTARTLAQVYEDSAGPAVDALAFAPAP